MLFHLGRYIRSQRMNKGMSRQQLAAAIGYKNTNKGARRIEDAEINGKLIDGLLDKISVALELDPDSIDGASQQDVDDFDRWLDEPVPREMIIRVMPAVYMWHELPYYIESDQQAIEYAKTIAQQYKRKVFLRLNRRWSVWIDAQGEGFEKATTFQSPVNKPYMRVKGDSKKFLLSLGTTDAII